MVELIEELSRVKSKDEVPAILKRHWSAAALLTALTIIVAYYAFTQPAFWIGLIVGQIAHTAYRICVGARRSTGGSHRETQE